MRHGGGASSFTGHILKGAVGLEPTFAEFEIQRSAVKLSARKRLLDETASHQDGLPHGARIPCYASRQALRDREGLEPSTLASTN